MSEVLVPDIGDFADVPVIEVLVTAGDAVETEQPLIVLESDKASMEVPSPSGGTVETVAVSVGDTVSQGDLILTLSDDGAAPEAEGEPEGGDAGEAPEAPEAPEGSEEDAGGEPDAGEQSPGAAGREAEQEGVGDEAPQPAAAGAGEPRDGDGDGVYAGPAVRRLARERGIDLASVRGTGRGGRVTKEDLEGAAGGGGRATTAATERTSAPPPAGAPAVEGLPAWPQVDFAAFGPVETVGLSRIKRIAGPALARNWVMIPHVTQHDEADITELEAFRVEVNAAHAEEGVKVTMVSLLLKACAAALRAFPEFNASLDGGDLVLKRYYHLGFAVDTPQGLLVPVIRDVDRKGLLEIARELTELSGAAREGALSREQMEGGTFTISSLGGIGGTAFTPIINAPEVAILGVSRSAMKPVWQDGEFVPRLMLPLSLSYDHRVVDGAAAARF
ncbi:MAG TPA: 2-oxo acid dehydrogenase subunit E2, partial [Miltoncostaeaceae bacterium]|nr:2-oxo acid dehydrogenase subunit E2 [Miltoncostaeaceae bacterium]